MLSRSGPGPGIGPGLGFQSWVHRSQLGLGNVRVESVKVGFARGWYRFPSPCVDRQNGRTDTRREKAHNRSAGRVYLVEPVAEHPRRTCDHREKSGGCPDAVVEPRPPATHGPFLWVRRDSKTDRPNLISLAAQLSALRPSSAGRVPGHTERFPLRRALPDTVRALLSPHLAECLEQEGLARGGVGVVVGLVEWCGWWGSEMMGLLECWVA